MIYFTAPNMAYCITKVVLVYNKSGISNKIDWKWYYSNSNQLRQQLPVEKYYILNITLFITWTLATFVNMLKIRIVKGVLLTLNSSITLSSYKYES